MLQEAADLLAEVEEESLMRMLSDSGNPRLSNFAELVECLFEHEGISLLDEE